jgi:hypothetical protein
MHTYSTYKSVPRCVVSLELGWPQLWMNHKKHVRETCSEVGTINM